MVQEIIIGLLFLGALLYIGRMIFRNTSNEQGCSKGCGCDSVVKQPRS